MKALIRNEGETIKETDGIAGIDWSNGYPLTEPKWFGGAYQLVQDYIPPKDGEPESYEAMPPAPPEEPEDVTVTEDTVIIDGKEYTKEELRALLGE